MPLRDVAKKQKVDFAERQSFDDRSSSRRKSSAFEPNIWIKKLVKCWYLPYTFFLKMILEESF